MRLTIGFFSGIHFFNAQSAALKMQSGLWLLNW